MLKIIIPCNKDVHNWLEKRRGEERREGQGLGGAQRVSL
jgi:hypothetical protein